MPTKTRGMTSLEIAIIVAIVLIIAIAVGWYLYTTFAAAGQQTGITVTQATVYVSSGSGGTSVTLALNLVPQGAAKVVIQSIEIAGKSISCNNAQVGAPGLYTVTLSGVTVQPGQVLTGRIVLTSGAISPFTATVVSGSAPTGGTSLSCSSSGG